MLFILYSIYYSYEIRTRGKMDKLFHLKCSLKRLPAMNKWRIFTCWECGRIPLMCVWLHRLCIKISLDIIMSWKCVSLCPEDVIVNWIYFVKQLASRAETNFYSVEDSVVHLHLWINGSKITFTPREGDFAKQFLDASDWFTVNIVGNVFNVT